MAHEAINNDDNNNKHSWNGRYVNYVMHKGKSTEKHKSYEWSVKEFQY